MRPITKLHTYLGIFEVNNSTIFDSQEVVNRYCRRRNTDIDSEMTRRMQDRTASWAAQDFFDACCRAEEMHMGMGPVKNVVFLAFLIKTLISTMLWLLSQESFRDLMWQFGVDFQYFAICELLRQFFLLCANNI